MVIIMRRLLIWVRLKAGLPAGDYDDEIVTLSGGAADNVNITISGSVNRIEIPRDRNKKISLLY